MRLRRAFAAGALLAGALGATGARSVPPAPPASAPRALPSELVLARYERALAKLERPKSFSFDYAVSQLGLHTMEQTHRVYRSGRSERDETRSADGYVLTQSSVRIFKNRVDRYDIATIAPKQNVYAFTFVDAVRRGDGFTYVFETTRRAAGAFAVREIELDGRTFLPAIVRFGVASGGTRGMGALTYAHSGRYWMIREARVNVRLKDGTEAREQIVWTNYRVTTSLPPSTFDAPRAKARPVPLDPEQVPLDPEPLPPANDPGA